MRYEPVRRLEPEADPSRARRRVPQGLSGIARLQRLAGNRAVTGLVRSSSKTGSSSTSVVTVQRAWYVNKRNGNVVWLNDGERSVDPPRDQVFAQLNPRGRPPRFQEVAEGDVAGQNPREGKNGWYRFALAQPKPDDGPPAKKQKLTEVGLPGEQDDALRSIPDELLGQVLAWLVDVRSVVGESIAHNADQVAKLTEVSRRWYHLVYRYPKLFGYYARDMDKIIQHYRNVGHPAKDKANVLDQRDLNGLRVVAGHLAINYPVESCTYVSLGNSPALFVEYFALLHPQAQIVRFPLSGVTGTEAEQQDTDEFRRLMHYVGRVMPATVRGRLVVIDMAEHGRALAVTKKLLDAYYQGKGPQPQVDMFGLTAVQPVKPGEEDLAHLQGTLNQVKVLPDNPHTIEVKERLVGCHYKSGLLLTIFEKHLIAEIQGGMRTEPALDRASYQRMLLIVQYARDILSKQV